MVFPRPEETAILIVGGREFRDWESVSVTWELRQHPYLRFRFTCSEGFPLSKNFAAMRIVPGMECTVILAGQQIVDGVVSTRQVFYDARRHHIEIQGASDTMSIAQASVVHKTGEFKDKNYQQYATELLKPFPMINFVVAGGQLPSTTFPRISIPPGTSVLEALELPLRSLGGIQLTSNPQGDLVAVVGPFGGQDTVYEGDLGRPSILEGRELIYNPGMASGIFSIGQKPGNNDEWGAKASHVPYHGNPFQSLAPSYAPQAVPLEIPAWTKDFLKGRSQGGQAWQQRDEVTVFATMQGWLRPSGGLWSAGQMVTVVSPMLVMDGGLSLQLKSATFTQDDKSGTRTVLELMNEAALAGFTPQGPGGG